MRCRINSKKLTFGVTMGVTIGALALGGSNARADDPGMMKGADSAGMSAPASMQPMAVTGQVMRYYVDRSGFVTAMDVQAADGVKMVRFSPGMAQKLTAAYPVGSTATVYVSGSPMMMGGMADPSMMRYDLVGMGATMPAPSAMMMPNMISDVDMLKAEPYITIGAKLMDVSGKLTGFVTDDMGEVLGLMLDSGALIRVPRENRMGGMMPPSMRRAPLFKGSEVMAVGYPEAPRYGMVSPFSQRLIATAITINGRAVGPLGFGMMKMSKKGTLFNLNIMGGGNMSPEETQASSMGYMTYTPADSSMGGAGMAPAGGTMDAGSTSSGSTMPK